MSARRPHPVVPLVLLLVFGTGAGAAQSVAARRPAPAESGVAGVVRSHALQSPVVESGRRVALRFDRVPLPGDIRRHRAVAVLRPAAGGMIIAAGAGGGPHGITAALELRLPLF